MRSSRPTRRLGLGLLVAVAAFGLVASACTPPTPTSRAVRAYGDSILYDGAPLANGQVVASPDPNTPWAGNTIKNIINSHKADSYLTMWDSQPGQTMASHGFRPSLDAAGGKFPAGTNVVVLSFGTNDAAWYIEKAAGNPWYANLPTYDVNAAKVHAAYWLQSAARTSGMKCVVWVLGRETNPAYNGNAIKATMYNQYLTALNGWIRTTGTQQGVALKIADWNSIAPVPGYTMADGMHPNNNGATELGNRISAQIATCPGV